MSQKSNVAIFAPIGLWEMHEAVTLEMVLIELNKGNKVVRFQCESALFTCAANAKHEKLKCKECHLRSKESTFLLHQESFNFKEIWITEKAIEKQLNKINLSNYSFEFLNSFTYDEMPFGRFIFGELITESQDIYLSQEKDSVRALNILKNSIALYEYFLEHLVSEEINSILIWNGRRTSEAAIAFAGKKLGIDCNYFNLGSQFNRFLLSELPGSQIEGINQELKKWYLMRKDLGQLEKMKKEGELYFADLRVGKSRTPHYEHFLRGYHDRYSVNIEGDKRKLLVIFTSSMWEYRTSPALEKINPEFQNQYALYEKIATNPIVTSKYIVVFRWHPNLVNAGVLEVQEMDRIIKDCSGVIHIKPEDRINSYSLLAEADVVVTTGSTMGIEAVIEGKPSILLGVAPYQGVDAVYEPSDFDEFVRLVSEPITCLPKDGAWAYGDWYRNFGTEFLFVDEKFGSYSLKGKSVHGKLKKCFRIERMVKRISSRVMQSLGLNGQMSRFRSNI